MEESIPELKAEFACIMCGGEKKNVNLPLKKDFTFAELLTKISFFF